MTDSGHEPHGQGCDIGTEKSTIQSLDIADSLTEFDGHVVGFCNPGCRDKFESAVRHFKEAKSATE